VSENRAITSHLDFNFASNCRHFVFAADPEFVHCTFGKESL